METRVEIIDNQKTSYILITVIGELQARQTTELAMEAIRIKKETGINRALWDLRKTELKDSFLDSHNFMIGLKTLGVDYSDSIAVVYRQNTIQHEHAENVAYNRGFYNIKYFKDYESALKWLIEN